MGQVINSSFAPFATPAQFVTLFDWRTFSQLASDTDTPLASSSALQNSPILLAKLQEGAGIIEAAATRGQRYDPINDLLPLITPQPVTGLICNSGWMLIHINTGLAASLFYDRRFESMPDNIIDRVKSAEEALYRLSAGEIIFAFTQTQAAGVEQNYQETPTDAWNRKLPSTVAHPLFGRRLNQYNLGP